MVARQTLLITGLSLSFGFGCSPASQPDPAQVDAGFDRLEQEIMEATNIFPLPKDHDQPDVPQPQSQREDGKIELADLGRAPRSRRGLTEGRERFGEHKMLAVPLRSYS